MFLFGVGKRCVSVTLVVEYRLRPGVLRGLGGSRRLEWPQMPRLRLPNYPEKEYFAHRLTFSDKMARKAARSSKKADPLPNLPENIWWRRGSSRGGVQRRGNGPVNRFQREGGEAGFASPYSPLPPAAAKRQVRCRTCLVNSGGGAENQTAYALRASAGLARVRSRRPCSAERATGTFRDPRNAGGVRFSNTAVITKKQAGFPDLLGFFGGGAENRTPVHTRSPTGRYKLVQRFEFGCETPVGGLLCILAGSIFA